MPSGADTAISGLFLGLVIRFSAVKHDLMSVGEIILDRLLEDAYVRTHESEIIEHAITDSEKRKLPKKKKPASVRLPSPKAKGKRK